VTDPTVRPSMTRQRDHYGDGDWYDAEYVHVGADIPDIREWGRRVGGPILELGCGTGRLTLPLAEVAPRVVGVDLSSPMIARARAKQAGLPPETAARLDLCVGDMRALDLGERFAGVLVGLNALMHMTTDADLWAALRTARRHLAPGGRLALDVFAPPPAAYGRDPDARFDPQEMVDPRDGQRYVVTESSRYDPARQRHDLTFHYQPVSRDGRPEGPELRADLSLRVVFPRELDVWLRLAGLRIVGDWDDLAATRPFSGTGGRRFVEAEATEPWNPSSSDPTLAPTSRRD
jgi:SAM-dependent methyltransferase